EVAKSFEKTDAKAKFFAQLSAAARENRFLPAFVIQQSLVSRQEFGPFYELLIARSAGLGSYDSDYSYTSLREANFDESDTKSALDQESDYKRQEPETSRIKWQKEYLDYLIEQRRNTDAQQLISTIERDLQRRYARLVWLCLASVRLDVRGSRIAQANEQLQWLVGIKTAINLDNPKAPSIERLNDAVAMLRGEGRELEANKLLEAAYARGIALGQFEPVHFNGLARLAFERGDMKLALTWLQSMIDLTAPESKEQTAASLMAMPLVAAHVENQPQSEDVQFDRITALRLAAETAGECGAFADGANCRQ